MGLEEVQRGLASLLTNERLREQFAADPRSVARTLNLSAEDAVELEALASGEVERFARSLCAKRWNEIQKLLPVSTQSAQMAGFGLRRLFLRFAQSYTPHGGKRHAQDALAFADWAAQQQALFQNNTQNAGSKRADSPDAAAAAWLPDLLRYEAAWLEMQMQPNRRWRLRRFAYPVPALARAVTLASSEDVTKGGSAAILPASFPFPARPLLVIWLRPRLNGPLRDHSLSLPVRRPHAKLGKLRA